MLTSFALIFLLGLALGTLFSHLKLPSLLGMVITGMILGPSVLNALSPAVISISPDLRKAALVIILTRAGLSLDLRDLKRVGRPAVLMCFLPACFEIAGVMLLAPRIFGISILDAAIIGSVIAAVSPAVIVPRMIRIMEEGYGQAHSIPQLILAGASVDDVFVIVLFTAFTALAQGGRIDAFSFFQIPISILTGISAGFLAGFLLIVFFKRFHMRDSVKILIIISISFLLLECETRLEGILPLSGLLAIMSMGIMLKQKYEKLAVRLSSKYNKLWVAAEVLLFVLVGATVDISYIARAGILSVLLVAGALIMRMAGVFICLLKTSLSPKERLFCMMAYTPKATVQAAIGGIPLSMGLSCGHLVLTVAVISILLTAPFGALCVDHSYKKLLS
ncbi:potassium transporter [Clostridium sp. chh4-2]|uniref:cation:proton antiporter n=1 Tax=Clostridium sp. chh4-2 TaxID=2067550 RepID=UPI000CCE2119|nr:cation:proton antiporter [Clostridium sp. chh4-2]PNV63371.1 potassium transporter [Clostridium sp. chh4-2]